VLSSSSKQRGELLVDNKKLIILSMHNYPSKTNFTEESYLKLKLRNNNTFMPHKTLGWPILTSITEK
ncbi:8350_t:CDS:2, partial [Rhizophagus irregularis]